MKLDDEEMYCCEICGKKLRKTWECAKDDHVVVSTFFFKRAHSTYEKATDKAFCSDCFKRKRNNEN